MRWLGDTPKRLLILAFLAIVGVSLTVEPPAGGSVKKKTYYFELANIDLAEGIPVAVEGLVREQVQASIANHDRITTSLPKGTPDPAEAPKKFKRYLQRKQLRAFKVHLEVTSYAHQVEAMPAPRQGQRLRVSIELRMFGETIPDRVIAFSGDGSSTVILEIGKKLRTRDSEVANHDAIELAVNKALERSIIELDQPPPSKKAKRRAKKK